ncbi:MAG: molybdopterin-binding protein [Desulfobacterales bacterium]|nr:molybdopterin-binding protein [Desulfobacterales bacterium]
MKKIKVQDAVGTELAHDITEVRPGEFKGPAFRKGHLVCDEDLCHLQRLGKNHLYILEMEEDELHENQAASILARAIAGDGIVWKDEPREGKINLFAGRDGLVNVDTAALAAFNMVDDVMCATLHNHTLVKEGELVAGTRAIPLVVKKTVVERAAAIAGQNGPLLSIQPLRSVKVGLVITGNEVYHGLIEDRFVPILSKKVEALGSKVHCLDFAPDIAEEISKVIQGQLEKGCGLLLLSGGMSVDPDDVTRHGIRLAGAGEFHYGAAVLPGAMFLVAYLGDVPLLGVPACGLYHRTTVLDLVLPRILAGEKIGKRDLAFLGHGGLCRDCKPCTFPQCGFGKGN